MVKQKKIYLISGIILSIVGIVLVSFYLKKEREKITQELTGAFKNEYKSLDSIIVAKRNIPAGVAIVSGMLEARVVPQQYIQPQAARSSDNIVGMKAAVPIQSGEQITLSKLIAQGGGEGRTLAMRVPVGKRAITISIDKTGGLIGMISAGDYVDVMAVLPIPGMSSEGKQVAQATTVSLFQNVLVLAVGRELGREQKSKGSPGADDSLITLALPSQIANLLSFVSEQAKIRLVLRSPMDDRVEQLPVANWQTLFQYLNFYQPAPAQIEEEPTTEPRKIEIYRGLDKGYIPVTK